MKYSVQQNDVDGNNNAVDNFSSTMLIDQLHSTVDVNTTDDVTRTEMTSSGFHHAVVWLFTVRWLTTLTMSVFSTGGNGLTLASSLPHTLASRWPLYIRTPHFKQRLTAYCPVWQLPR